MSASQAESREFESRRPLQSLLSKQTFSGVYPGVLLNESKLSRRVARARSAVGSGIRYGLGHGGKNPYEDLPTNDGFCDCSGFIAWAIGLARAPKPQRNWWIETSRVFQDANGPQTAFRRLPGPKKGALLVYPDRRILRRMRQGHIALITDVKDGAIQIVDCSSNGTPNAIRERDGGFMIARGAIVCTLQEDFL